MKKKMWRYGASIQEALISPSLQLQVHFVDFLPDLTTFDNLFHLFYCIYGGILKCQSQQDGPVAGFLWHKCCQVFGTNMCQRLKTETEIRWDRLLNTEKLQCSMLVWLMKMNAKPFKLCSGLSCVASLIKCCRCLTTSFYPSLDIISMQHTK